MIDHHPAIVSKETFETAKNLLDFNRKEKNIETGSRKCLKRYAFSGKVFCGQCGGKWKRQARNGIPCYVCENHIKDMLVCATKSVHEDAIQAAFLTMMNKLTFARKEILYLISKRGGKDADAVYDRINELQDALEKILVRKDSVQTFFTRGLLDPGIYQEEIDAIQEEERQITSEKERLSKKISKDHDKAAAISKLLGFTAKGYMVTEFDPDLFTEHVEKIVIISRTEAEFHLKCGLTLRERMQL